MTREEALKLRAIIEQSVESLNDETALEAISLFEPYKVGENYAEGKRFKYNGNLYKVRQEHTSQEDWNPEVTTSLYVKVALETEGTINNPIAYDGNMALENGKYYIQNEVVYLCNRDTVNPVYNALADLVGLYVEVV